MAPLSNKEGYKNSKMIVKRFWNKMVSKTDTKENMKKGKSVDELVFDSVPTDDFEEKNADDPYESISIHNEDNKNEQSFSETDDVFKDDDIFDEEDTTKVKDEEENPQKRKGTKNSSHKSVINNTTVNHGIVHIGDKYVHEQTWNVQQTYNVGEAKKERKKQKNVKLTPKIKELLKCDASLGTDHITKLSDHLGASWRDVGIKLKLTCGELDIIESCCKNDLKQVAFEVLSVWMRRKGDKATVGRLCQKLWNSGVPNAKDAVKKLCDVMPKFN